MSFKRRPDARSWAEEARVISSESEPKRSRPWDQHDPKSKEVNAEFNLRLNAYDLELLRAVAPAEGRSQQAVAKRALRQYLEAAARELGLK